MRLFRIKTALWVAMATGPAFLWAAARGQNRGQPSIEFTVVPPSTDGNPIRLDVIEGRANAAVAGERIVLFARTAAGVWYRQFSGNPPFTEVGPDAKWRAYTHPGLVYAALLVDGSYVPPKSTDELPAKGGPVLAVATVTGPPPSPPHSIQFSGYPWKVREGGRSQAGQVQFYDHENVWTDVNGYLHLQIKRKGNEWRCAEVTLARGLGYGTYRFVVRDISGFEPAVVLGVGPAAKMAIELSRWGRTEGKNAQYVVRPYTVPANLYQFMVPGGTLTQWMEWAPGRVTFRTLKGGSPKPGQTVVAEHTFTSGVQAPGTEGESLNLYFFETAAHPLKHEVEVVVEKFEYLP